MWSSNDLPPLGGVIKGLLAFACIGIFAIAAVAAYGAYWLATNISVSFR